MNTTISRRALLSRASTGFGMAALAGLMHEDAQASLAHRAKRFAPKARSVIFLYMSGGVSHVDSFDHKPMLKKFEGKPMPMAVKKTQFNNNGTIMPTQWEFRPRGACGIEVSDLFPQIGGVIDDICQLRSMTAKFSEHAQGNFFMHSGFPFLGFPSAGAWTSYGLGTESRDLPGYVVLQSGGAATPHGGVGLFSNGFLPAQHQASIVKADEAEAVANIRPRQPHDLQRRQLDFIGAMDKRFASTTTQHDTHIEAAISNYEMAWRMQAAVPDLCDISGETEATKKLYGLDDPEPKKAAYARQCLLARRLVERGVRFIELSTLAYNLGGGNAANPWDHHGAIKEGHGKMANQIDQPIAALIKDLKARGLLDSTLIVWAGEFGRTPMGEQRETLGRDHHIDAFTLSGAGIQGGIVHGATDDLGYAAVEKVTTVHDLHATMLHQLGIQHDAFTYKFQGLDARLTGVEGANVITDILT